MKSRNPDIQVIAVEPASSPVLSEGKAGAHKNSEFGAGFVPDVLNTNIYDRVITVDEEDAFRVGRMIGKRKVFLSEFLREQPLMLRLNLRNSLKMKGRILLYFYRIPETDICLPHYFPDEISS